MEKKVQNTLKELCADIQTHKIPFIFLSWDEDHVIFSSNYQALTLPSHIVDSFVLTEKIIEILSNEPSPLEIVKFVTEIIPIKKRLEDDIRMLPPKFVNWDCSDEWSLVFDDRCRDLFTGLTIKNHYHFFTSINSVEVVNTEYVSSNEAKAGISMRSVHSSLSDFASSGLENETIGMGDILHILASLSRISVDSEKYDSFKKVGLSLIDTVLRMLNVHVAEMK